ncbi:MSP (major sperm protein) domain protein (macronuclear) [Tetrahymena thermophila SB210]|uniref:MSP (Major sperm protein) domain protein n=1 Tax=Tetrahymena thermophila (strain SB210) TaxID=312017 RepID=Q23K09_TETTS|nr:MSP (major sperm protein) domain protein [Tetrahymena thermophila SB210]EAR97034.2 MSP (major sperm protein) domain protein [Tetrahymena thermophila SB210]|eukprot:XP_001017279.2 MSP (major sperm protein) domain protein [Tetrahymena thermophila SB210]
MTSKQDKPNRFDELIEIDGLKNNNFLCFNFKPNQLMNTSLTLKNISRNKIYYKFKTNNPKCFSVQPNQKEIHPNCDVIVEFTMQPRREYNQITGDKFQIDVAELTEQILQEGQDVSDILKKHVQGNKKVDVFLVSQQQQNEKIVDFSFEGNVTQRENSLMNSSKLYASVNANEEEKRLNEALNKAKSENQILAQQNKDLEKKVKELQKIQQASNQEANFTMFHVIIVAIIALIAGAFLAK